MAGLLGLSGGLLLGQAAAGGGGGAVVSLVDFARTGVDNTTSFNLSGFPSGTNTYLVGYAGQTDFQVALDTLGGQAITEIDTIKGPFDQCTFGYVTVTGGGAKTLALSGVPTMYRSTVAVWDITGLDPSLAVHVSQSASEGAFSTTTYDGGARVGIMTGKNSTSTTPTDAGIVGLDTEDVAPEHIESGFWTSASHQADTADGSANVTLDGNGANVTRTFGLVVSIPPV